MSCGIGSLGCGKSEQAQEQPSGETDQEAIAALEKLGAKIQKDDDGKVVVLNFFDTKTTDAGLVHFKGLTKLKSLGLYGTQAGVADLQKALPDCEISH